MKIAPTTDRYYKEGNFLRNFIDSIFLKQILKEVQKYPNVRSILDIGCGEGFIVNTIMNNTANINIVCMDISFDKVHRVKRNFNCQVICADAYHLPFRDNSFDMTICTEVIEHLYKPELSLKEIVRVTQNFFILSVPLEPFFQLKDLIRGKYIKRLGRNIEHIQGYNMKQFFSLVSKCIEPQFKCFEHKIICYWQLLIANKQ